MSLASDPKSNLRDQTILRASQIALLRNMDPECANVIRDAQLDGAVQLSDYLPKPFGFSTVVDATSAFERALAKMQSHQNGEDKATMLILPRGRFKITSSIIQQANPTFGAIGMVGQGAANDLGGTIIEWGGASADVDSVMFDFQGGALRYFSGIQFRGNAKCGGLMWMRRYKYGPTPSEFYGASRWFFEACSFVNVTDGGSCVKIGFDDGDGFTKQADLTMFLRCHISGGDGATSGVQWFEAGNTKDFWFIGCIITDCDIGLNNIKSGHLSVRDCYIGNCQTGVLAGGVPVVIDATPCEGVGRYFDSGGGDVPGGVTISNSEIVGYGSDVSSSHAPAVSDDGIVRVNGSCILMNNTFSNGRAVDSVPKIMLSFGNTVSNIYGVCNKFLNAVTDVPYTYYNGNKADASRYYSKFDCGFNSENNITGLLS